MSEISADYLNELRDAFKDFDKDNNGAIATKELGKIYFIKKFKENILKYFN